MASARRRHLPQRGTLPPLPMGSTATNAIRLPSAAGFGLLGLKSASGLSAQLLPSGALFALRHRETLINQLLPGPAEDGLFRLLLRRLDEHGAPAGWSQLVGATAEFAHADGAASWRAAPWPGLVCVTTLSLHPQHAAWAWRVELRNDSAQTLRADVLHAQDLGLGDQGAVRNNEAYISHYLDLQPVADPALGHVVLARQNQPMAGGRHPWAAFACAEGAAAYCTDGWQFFGADHRLTGEPAAVRERSLPSRRWQYESALAGLQSPPLALAPGARAAVTFLAIYAEDHPEASGAADLARLHALRPLDWVRSAPAGAEFRRPGGTVFTTAPRLAAEPPAEGDLAAWFGAERRHLERDAAGHTLGFFHGEDTHVVTRRKEAAVLRPHGHILRSGRSEWIDDAQFGVTCYAAGIFGAQAYLGNCSLVRFLSVARNALGVARAGGQRVFVRQEGSWRQLGVPTVFAMSPGAVRWLYKFADSLVEARVWCSESLSASYLRLRVLAGPEREFLVTHQLALGVNEFEAGGSVEFHGEAAWMSAQLDPGSFSGRHLPHTVFALAADEPRHVAALGGAELLGATGPYAVLQTRAVRGCGVILLGSNAGGGALAAAVAAARAEFAAGGGEARPPAAPVRLGGSPDPGVARLDEIVPWFAHNAAIHFSAPHGLEQYGGAAWGVRDVCQGSVEWLLAAGEFATVRRILLAVFAQQYAAGEQGSVAGGWPQWFMFEPFRSIQQAHSHGDVCFWPVKALCDYVEASDDFSLLAEKAGYTDPHTFQAGGPGETLWAHCDRVLALAEARFMPGTALVNYGDGDWDDTLQPADPTLRTRMVSAWTVGLAFHAFRQLAEVSRRAGEQERAARLEATLRRMREDFAAHLVRGGVVAGFLVNEADGTARPLLHPEDRVTGIRYRLLPMTRAILAELFTPEEAERHRAIVARELMFTDGVRLMSEPARYHGGLEKLFKRAETAANVGREVGLQYVHAHLRYAEAMARLGRADELWEALQVVNPVGLERVVPRAAPRQSNVYFSSSDADFADRLEFSARWPELRAGRIALRAGWRLYSSGPGLYLHKVRACLLGLRESFGTVIFDPVLPRSLDGLIARTHLCGRQAKLVFTVRHGTSSPRTLRVNGTDLGGAREANPYRAGGLQVPADRLVSLLNATDNLIEIEL
ncbi:MAG: hypothetical protein C0502_07345 [Opitutus sp.]|nr:hypothetical protein [Opitutus sp.]